MTLPQSQEGKKSRIWTFWGLDSRGDLLEDSRASGWIAEKA
jgi:hypothetical protein